MTAAPPAGSAPRSGGLLALLSPLLVYGGVAAGLYGLRSGWAGIAGYHLAVVLVLVLGGGWREAPALLRGWTRGLGLGLVALCLTAGVAVGLLWPFIRLEEVTMRSGLVTLGLEGWPWLAFAVYYSVVNPWIEELYWRWWYPTRVRPALLGDLLFAGYHVMVMVLFVRLPYALLTFGVLVAVSLVWRWVARRQGGLLVPLASHLAADLSIVSAAAALVASP